jgi:hypothetical protein
MPKQGDAPVSERPFNFVEDRIPWLQGIHYPKTLALVGALMARAQTIRLIEEHNTRRRPDSGLKGIANMAGRIFDSGLFIAYGLEVNDFLLYKTEVEEICDESLRAHAKWLEKTGELLRGLSHAPTAKQAHTNIGVVHLNNIMRLAKTEVARGMSTKSGHDSAEKYEWLSEFGSPEEALLFLFAEKKRQAMALSCVGLFGRAAETLDGAVGTGLVLRANIQPDHKMTEEWSQKEWSQKELSQKSASIADINTIYEELVEVRNVAQKRAQEDGPHQVNRAHKTNDMLEEGGVFARERDVQSGIGEGPVYA